MHLKKTKTKNVPADLAQVKITVELLNISLEKKILNAHASPHFRTAYFPPLEIYFEFLAAQLNIGGSLDQKSDK